MNRINPRKKAASPAQQQQRELAWLLFITEGYIGNLHAALAVNSYTLDARTLHRMERLRLQAENTAMQIRQQLSNIESEI